MSDQNNNNNKPQSQASAQKQPVPAAPVVTTASPEVSAPKAEATTGLKEIRVKLSNPTKIEFVVCNTGERNTRMIHESKFILSKATLFKIPLSDSTMNYSDSNLIRLVTPVTESIRILDIVNGIATIEPIVHGSFVEDGQLLGYIY